MRSQPPFAPPPPVDAASAAPVTRKWPRLLRRGPMENLATAFIVIGVVMLMQPFSLAVFSYSFVTILVGTGTFMIVSHFPS
jgi:hypothetical protein